MKCRNIKEAVFKGASFINNIRFTGYSQSPELRKTRNSVFSVVTAAQQTRAEKKIQQSGD